MPPPGYEPFLHAICANPEDDTVRLVYADWLDEHGDPARAEFIRLQIRLHHAMSQDSPEFEDALARAEQLIRWHGKLWTWELPPSPGLTWPNEFQRGFFESVCARTAKWFIKHRKQAFRVAPIRHLTVSEAGEESLAALFAVPEIERLRGLSLQSCRVPPDRLRVLTHCPPLVNLRELEISGRTTGTRYLNFTDEEARELVDTPFLPALEAIYFYGDVSPEAEQLLRTRFKIVGR
jgi:uncharacterized protein (TIGR02996 family)